MSTFGTDKESLFYRCVASAAMELSGVPDNDAADMRNGALQLGRHKATTNVQLHMSRLPRCMNGFFINYPFSSELC